MGGYGSGRKMTRVLGSGLRRLNANDMRKAGALKPDAVTTWTWSKDGYVSAKVALSTLGQSLRLRYHSSDGAGGWAFTLLNIQIVWQGCHFGGERAYFLCPRPECNRWAYILYGDQDFVCRRCRKVAYELQRLPPESRALARAQQLRLALGGSVDVSGPFPPRPKGMHDWTYTKLGIRIYAAERRAAGCLLDLLSASSKSDTRSAKGVRNEG